MNFIQLLVLCALSSSATPAVAQEPAAGPPAPGHEIGRWQPLDGVAIVVNSDPVTRRALERDLQKRAAERPITTQEELQYLIFEAQMKQVDTLLMRQAGEDLGFPQEVVAAHIAGQIDDQKKEAGGIHEMTNQLRQDSQTQKELSEDLETELYEISFKRRVMGYGGAQERTSQDRFVRPGILARQYRHIQRTGLAIDPLLQVGASPATYELQVLLLTPETYGSLEAAKRGADTARAALVSGQADWDDLIDTVGGYPDRGLVGPRRIEDLRLNLDPGNNSLVQFLMEGREDVYSPVLPFPRINPATGQRPAVAFAIYRLVGRAAAKLPGFGEPGVQRNLRRFLEAKADDARLTTALDDLKANAYIWYTGIEEEKAAYEARQAEFELEIEEARRRNADFLREAEPEPQAGPEAAEQAPEDGQAPATGGNPGPAER